MDLLPETPTSAPVSPLARDSSSRRIIGGFGDDSTVGYYSQSEPLRRVSGEQDVDHSLRLHHTRKDKTAYYLDRILAKRWRVFLALGIWGVLQVCTAGSIYALIARSSTDPSEREPEFTSQAWVEGVWDAWTFMADPGTHATVPPTAPQRIVSSAITMMGILFFASVLGLTVDMIREKMDSLRQGKSRIIETDHTLILGWTEKTVHIIEEICKANESEGGGVICILAGESKEQMELELDLALPRKQRLGTRVVFRSGSSLVMADLIRVSVHMARAIIILASSTNPEQADNDTLRTLVSLRSIQANIRGHVVAEVRDIDNEPLMKLVGGEMLETIVTHDMIGRLMLMSVRHPGLAKVYEGLLGFDGDEFYVQEWPSLVGKTFKEVLTCFPEAVPIGIQFACGEVVLKPEWSYELVPGDKVIVIAEDNDSYSAKEPLDFDPGDPPPLKPPVNVQEKMLLCGWRCDIRDVLEMLDKIVVKGSEAHIMTHYLAPELRNQSLLEDGLDVNTLKNLKVIHHFGNTSVRRKLAALPIAEFTACMIFADEAFQMDTLHADSHSLATLLLMRDLQRKHTSKDRRSKMRFDNDKLAELNGTGEAMCPMICEIMDPHTQKTISHNPHLSNASDFCQTNKLIAQACAMVAEMRTVNLLFEELLGSGGVNIAVVPSSRYCEKGEPVSFVALALRAVRFEELLIGFQLRNSSQKTELNPSNKSTPFVWDRYDFAVLVGKPLNRKPRDTVTTQLRTMGERDRLPVQFLRSASKLSEAGTMMVAATSNESQGIKPHGPRLQRGVSNLNMARQAPKVRSEWITNKEESHEESMNAGASLACTSELGFQIGASLGLVKQGSKMSVTQSADNDMVASTLLQTAAVGNRLPEGERHVLAQGLLRLAQAWLGRGPPLEAPHQACLEGGGSQGSSSYVWSSQPDSYNHVDDGPLTVTTATAAPSPSVLSSLFGSFQNAPSPFSPAARSHSHSPPPPASEQSGALSAHNNGSINNSNNNSSSAAHHYNSHNHRTSSPLNNSNSNSNSSSPASASKSPGAEFRAPCETVPLKPPARSPKTAGGGAGRGLVSEAPSVRSSSTSPSPHTSKYSPM